VAVVINEKGQRLDRLSFPQERAGYNYFLEHLEGLRQKHRAREWYSHGTFELLLEVIGQELEEKAIHIAW